MYSKKKMQKSIDTISGGILLPGMQGVKISSKNIVDKQFISTFLKDNPGSEKYDIKGILFDFNKKLSDIIIRTRDGIELPNNLGSMFTITYPKKDNRVNILRSKELCSVVTYTNAECDGYQCRIVHVTDQVKTRNKYSKFWGFTPSRDTNKQLSIVYPTQWKIYVLVANILFASGALRRKRGAQESAREHQRIELKTYNEFNFD